MDITGYKQLTIPKIEAGKITKVVRDVIQSDKLLNKMSMKEKRRNLNRLLSNWKKKSMRLVN